MKVARRVTRTANKAIEILFVENPRGTSLGAFLGISIYGILRFLGPAIRGFRYFDLEAVNPAYLMAFGILMLNIPKLFDRRTLPEDVENALTLIEMQEAHLSADELRMLRLEVATRLVQKIGVAPAARDDGAPPGFLPSGEKTHPGDSTYVPVQPSADAAPLPGQEGA